MEDVEVLESEVSQLYSLLDNYKIFIMPTDLAMFQTLSPTLRSLKEALDIAQDSKEQNISKFTFDLQKMLSDLSGEVSDIRNAAQDPMVLNSSSNNDEVIIYLEGLRKQLERVEILKQKYENWGKLFKRGGTNKTVPDIDENQDSAGISLNENSEMAETKQEVELKTSLWTSLKDWNALTR